MNIYTRVKTFVSCFMWQIKSSESVTEKRFLTYFGSHRKIFAVRQYHMLYFYARTISYAVFLCQNLRF